MEKLFLCFALHRTAFFLKVKLCIVFHRSEMMTFPLEFWGYVFPYLLLIIVAIMDEQ